MKCRFKRSISVICVLLLIISTLSLSACGKDSDSIVGTWEGSFPISSHNYADSISFYKDDSFTLVYYDRIGDLGVIDGTYNIIRDGSALELIPTGYQYNTVIFEYDLPSNNSLVLLIDGEGYTLKRAD